MSNRQETFEWLEWADERLRERDGYSVFYVETIRTQLTKDAETIAVLREALEKVCNSAVDCAHFDYEMMVKREIIHSAETTLSKTEGEE